MFSFSLNPLYVDLVKTNHYEEAENISKFCNRDSQFFFYKALASYKTKEYKKTIDYAKQAKLYSIPERYSVLLDRMLEDIEQFGSNKLVDISGDMRISLERLDLGKGGPKTQSIQASIIKKLDDQIKSLEDEMNKNQNQSKTQGKKNESNPMPESKIIEDTPPEGKVNKKNLINGGEWGKLPKKESTKISANISKILPIHIREASEGFTKKLQNPK